MRIPYETMAAEFARVLEARGFKQEDARMAGEIFAQNSLAGVYSHGLNRFPRIVSNLDTGDIDPTARATTKVAFGSMEQWDGHRGFGPLNAKRAMDRACELAKTYGIGLVALGNNNHWLRGGTYGWQAAEKGCIAICWSLSTPNMPAWGGKDCRIGNNPLVFAVPRSDGRHVVVDCAMSQFSYGKIEQTRFDGKQLPVPGGYNEAGEPTADPAEIEKTRRVLPMGYWKGSGFSILLDLIATMLSGGYSVSQIGTFPNETGVTQIMIAIDPSKFGTVEELDAVVEQILGDVKQSQPAEEGGQVFYPGEQSMLRREQNLELGIPVEADIWNKVLEL